MNVFSKIPQVSAAEITNPAIYKNIQTKSGPDYVATLIQNLITWALVIATVAAAIVLLIGGVRWVTSAGDREAASSAQKTITGGIIGLVVAFSTFAVVKVLEVLFGIDLLTIDIEPLFLK
jgi:hypothetical protein